MYIIVAVKHLLMMESFTWIEKFLIETSSMVKFRFGKVLFVRIFLSLLASNDNLRFIEKFLEQTLNTTTRKVDQDLTRNFNRIIRDVEEYDDDSDDIEDDIEIEETDEETPSPTTEELEKDEIIDQVEKELESEIGNSSTFDVLLEANNSGLIKAKQNNVDKTLPNQLLTLLCCVIFVIINNI